MSFINHFSNEDDGLYGPIKNKPMLFLIDNRIDNDKYKLYKETAVRVLNTFLKEIEEQNKKIKNESKKKKLWSLCCAIGWYTIPGPYIAIVWNHKEPNRIEIVVYDD